MEKPAQGAANVSSVRATARTAAVARSEFFEQPVPRRFVHRASVAEVLITGFAQDDRPDTFLLAAQWPRGHSFYRTVRGLHDPLLFGETIRQAGLMISHVGYKAPLSYASLMANMAYDVSAAGLRCEGTPTNLILSASARDVKFRKDTLLGFQLVAVLRRGLELEPVGIASGEMQIVSPGAYRRLRGGAGPVPAAARRPLAEPVSPALVGKEVRADVVLTPTETDNTWLLRADTTHPVLFDHPVDHVPGMVLVEAMRQAAHCALYPRNTTMIRYAVKFERYAELTGPTIVRAFPEGADPDGSVRVRVEITQDGGACVAAVGWCTSRVLV
ncbi:MAG: ScbA/BarX family gamma-butyrolactone biosynthesis protein [Actinocrinis sp.]